MGSQYMLLTSKINGYEDYVEYRKLFISAGQNYSLTVTVERQGYEVS